VNRTGRGISFGAVIHLCRKLPVELSLSQTSKTSCKIGEPEGRKAEGEEVVGRWVVGRIWSKQCIHIYVNAKMIPVETVLGMGGEGNSSMIYLIHCKNLCKCYNVPTPNTTIKKEQKCQ
jgi:hypothetical protein